MTQKQIALAGLALSALGVAIAILTYLDGAPSTQGDASPVIEGNSGEINISNN